MTVYGQFPVAAVTGAAKKVTGGDRVAGPLRPQGGPCPPPGVVPAAHPVGAYRVAGAGRSTLPPPHARSRPATPAILRHTPATRNPPMRTSGIPGGPADLPPSPIDGPRPAGTPVDRPARARSAHPEPPAARARLGSPDHRVPRTPLPPTRTHPHRLHHTHFGIAFPAHRCEGGVTPAVGNLARAHGAHVQPVAVTPLGTATGRADGCAGSDISALPGTPSHTHHTWEGCVKGLTRPFAAGGRLL